MITIEELNGQIATFFSQQSDPVLCARSYNKIAEQLSGLFREKVEPGLSSLQETLKDKVNNHTASIANIQEQNADVLSLIEKERSLEEEKHNLLVLHQELNERWSVIENLKKKKEELEKPENHFDVLEEETRKINFDNDKIVADQMVILDRVNELLGNCSTEMDKKLKDVIQRAKDNLMRVNEQSGEFLSSLNTDPLDICSNVLNEQLDQLITAYNQYVEKIKAIKGELEVVEKKHSGVVKLYKDQYFTDKMIFGNLDERGNVEDYISKHAKEIEDFLQKFESMLKELIDKRESLPMPEIYEKQYGKTSEEKDI